MKGKKIEWFFLPFRRPPLAGVPEGGGYERQKDRVVLFCISRKMGLCRDSCVSGLRIVCAALRRHNLAFNQVEH
jgi:hypothetical protein